MSGSSSSASIRTSSTASSVSTTGHDAAQPTTAKLRISLDSGETRCIEVPRQLGEWDLLKADPGFQARVRGFVLVVDGRSYSLAAPRGFRRVSYNVEVVHDREPAPGENVAPAAIRASYHADVVLASMTMYLKGSPPMVRFDVKLAGKLRWQAP